MSSNSALRAPPRSAHQTTTRISSSTTRCNKNETKAFHTDYINTGALTSSLRQFLRD